MRLRSTAESSTVEEGEMLLPGAELVQDRPSRDQFQWSQRRGLRSELFGNQ